MKVHVVCIGESDNDTQHIYGIISPSKAACDTQYAKCKPRAAILQIKIVEQKGLEKGRRLLLVILKVKNACNYLRKDADEEGNKRPPA